MEIKILKAWHRGRCAGFFYPPIWLLPLVKGGREGFEVRLASAFTADKVFLEFGHETRTRSRYFLKIREVTYAV